MKGLSISSFAALLCLLAFTANAQTYTFNPTKSGCSNSWMDGNCWDKVNLAGCTNSSSTYPPIIAATSLPGYNSIRNNCTVNIILNQTLTLDPGFDFAFNAPFYNITLSEGVSLNIPRHVYLLERSALTFNHAAGTGSARINIAGNIFYEKQAVFNLRSGTTLEVDNVLNPSSNQYEGILFQVDLGATIRVNGTLSFTNGNSNKVIVEGVFEVNQLNLDAGSPGTTSTAIASKNSLIIRGTGSSNVCSGVSIKGDSYLNVDVGGTLNLVSLELSGTALFDIYGTANIKSMSMLSDSWTRMFSASQFNNQTFTKFSATSKIYKCDTEVASPSTNVGGCTAGYAVLPSEDDWDEFTGDWCFRLLPIKILEERLLFDQESKSIRLHWVTVSERENSHFEIERSNNSINEFVKIGTVKGMVWSNEAITYEFEDSDYPMTGERLYYRIRQVDVDGEFSFGGIMGITPTRVINNNSTWYVYPNPNDGNKLMVKLADILPGTGLSIRFRIFNSFTGTKEYFASSEKEMNDILSTLARNLPKGINVLEIQVDDRYEMIKFIIN